MTKKKSRKVLLSSPKSMGKSYKQFIAFVKDVKTRKKTIIVGPGYIVLTDYLYKLLAKENSQFGQSGSCSVNETAFKDMNGDPIFEGDILAGKTDRDHPMAIGASYERGYVHRHPFSGEGWFWKGHKLENVAKNVLKIGSIFTTPEKLLYE